MGWATSRIHLSNWLPAHCHLVSELLRTKLKKFWIISTIVRRTDTIAMRRHSTRSTTPNRSPQSFTLPTSKILRGTATTASLTSPSRYTHQSVRLGGTSTTSSTSARPCANISTTSKTIISTSWRVCSKQWRLRISRIRRNHPKDDSHKTESMAEIGIARLPSSVQCFTSMTQRNQ